ncbi:hypothetical protein DB895_11645 [Flavobacterium psychrotolerans]|uniref:Uncharacterized protein n=1 Tax=Flavobacterium psychrotolerans TaxID=2169410 RepID=A0A2U1JGK0_9FLAO|nr:hypothetical protein DB895_11645 [Flavobacterium psychrotolerans]
MFFGGVETFLIVFLTFGFITSLVAKEIYQKNEYLFYLNNGISKMQLLLISSLFNVLFEILGILFLYLMSHLF